MPPTSYKQAQADRCTLFVSEQDERLAMRVRQCFLPEYHEGACLSWWGWKAAHETDSSGWVFPPHVFGEDTWDEDDDGNLLPWFPPPMPSPESVDEARRMLAYGEAIDEMGVLTPAQADRVRTRAVISDPTAARAHAIDRGFGDDADLAAMRVRLAHEAEQREAEASLADTRTAARADYLTAKYGDAVQFLHADVTPGIDRVRLSATAEPLAPSMRPYDGRSIVWPVSCPTLNRCMRDGYEQCDGCQRAEAEWLADDAPFVDDTPERRPTWAEWVADQLDADMPTAAERMAEDGDEYTHERNRAWRMLLAEGWSEYVREVLA